MKRKLLYLTTVLLFSAFAMNAQTKIWDFGNDTTDWDINSTGYSATTEISKLTVVPGTSTNFGIIDANSYTFAQDDFSSSKRFKFGGTSNVADNMPKRNYLTFPVSGNCTIKVWFRTGSTNVARSLYVSDGSILMGSATTGTGAGLDHAIMEVTYTGGATTLYIYGDSVNLYKIEVSGTGASTLGSKKFNNAAVATVYTVGSEVFVTNLKSETQVSVYSITGALVKSAKTASNVSFNLQPGVYIVKAQAAEGVQSVKVVVN